MSRCWGQLQVLHPLQPASTSTTHYSPILRSNVTDSYSTMAEVKQHHSLLIRLGLSSNNHAITPIIIFSSLSNHGDFHYSLKLFSTLPNPDTFLFNTLLKSFLFHNYHFPFNSIFLFYSYMLHQQHSLTPNSFTFPSLIKACSLHNAVQQGKQIHAHVLKFGFGLDTFALNNLIHMYVNFGYLGDARKVFDRMPATQALPLPIRASTLHEFSLQAFYTALLVTA
ncbi:hypothetical protein TanjilG_29171 [Lupinus angustifolius]|uniref:Pentatricopeptide repeat-containing protein n=1 Tax=Lupinus angustifolius TaxID=3871 RepID=A0A1J7HEP9_LUPAN|nr:hypothetical protein TanjilG_29171 [Lupinus angustifolius]